MNPYPHLNSNLIDIDIDTQRIIEFEKRRQERKIILIASESICPKPVLEAQTSVFSNLYAEGYPSVRMMGKERKEILDYEKFLNYHRRLGDRRHYQGCDYANFIEALAQWRAAQLFAHEDGHVSIEAEDIYVNVQPLSGAAANNAVFHAFVGPGETVLGLALPHGGHLTHGSPFNRSGKLYRGISYEIDLKTGKVDYDRIRQIACEERPRLIIGGASAYPWHIDWRKMREIADEIGALLLADIAHPSGLVAAGLFPNPVGYAHVTTMTTHKTLCGPRGAIVLTTDAKIARKINSAVFPGEQGGPHINTIAGLAVVFKLAAQDEFKQTMKNVLTNAQALVAGLEKRGLGIAYGGTETHLCLVDLNKIKTPTGNPIKGDIVAHILDLCGITCNKNTIAGDVKAGDSSAVRLGTTWVSQLGMGAEQMDKIAELIHKVITNIHTYPFHTAKSTRFRGKIDHELMLEVRKEIDSLVKKEQYPAYPQFPHYHAPFTAAVREVCPATKSSQKYQTTVIHDSEGGLLEVAGAKARAFLQEIVPSDIDTLEIGQGIRTFMLDEKGQWIDHITIFRMDEEKYWLTTSAQKREHVKEWLANLSDGYILLDRQCPATKLPGPVFIRDLADTTKTYTTFVLLGNDAKKLLATIDDNIEQLQDCRWHKVSHQNSTIFIAGNGYGKEFCFYQIFIPYDEAPALYKKLQEQSNSGDRQILEDLYKKTGLPTTGKIDIAFVSKIMPGIQRQKPYFIGNSALDFSDIESKSTHHWQEYEGDVRFTALAETHKTLTSRPLAPFAGWWMPILYTSILEEHKAVRETAGLFDVTHMGIVEVEGAGAERFLNLLTTNDVSRLIIGQSQYSYILTPEGVVLDDILVYRRGNQKYMVVVNASNAEKDYAWMQAIAEGKVIIDPRFPALETDVRPIIRDLRDSGCGDERRVDIALQGPHSKDILLTLAGSDQPLQQKIKGLKGFRFVEVELANIPVIISRSGYTGEIWGYELYVHPDRVVELWNLLLEKGKEYGIKPTGLGARDSTRTEAGFPLHGHELAGNYDISPYQAGYGSFVKYYKPFFVGKHALFAKDAESRHQIVRFIMDETGIRAVRTGALVFNKKGQVIGEVTSCTFVENRQIGLAYIDRRYCEQGVQLGIMNVEAGRKGKVPKALSELKMGDKFPVYSTATILPRFMKKSKKTK